MLTVYFISSSNCAVPENIHTLPEEDHWKFRGAGGLKSESNANFLKGNYEAKLEIPGGGGGGGGGVMDIFWNDTLDTDPWFHKESNLSCTTFNSCLSHLSHYWMCYYVACVSILVELERTPHGFATPDQTNHQWHLIAPQNEVLNRLPHAML